MIRITVPIFWISGMEALFTFLFLVFALMVIIWVYKLVASLIVGG